MEIAKDSGGDDILTNTWGSGGLEAFEEMKWRQLDFKFRVRSV